MPTFISRMTRRQTMENRHAHARPPDAPACRLCRRRGRRTRPHWLRPRPCAPSGRAGERAQPSFYRFKLGTIEITVVSDGTLAFPAETLWGDRADDARGLLTSTFQPSSPVGLQINTILVNTGDKLVLIDAGCGVDKFQNTNGRLLVHLANAGYAPGDIDMILFTHCHFDHLWGISDGKNASLLFPSAEFVASETEVAFWSAPDLV